MRRPDLDGIRGLAIVLVVIYHVAPRSLTGGYTGVDAFFVLSGYLITRRIRNDVLSGSFKLSAFYARRIRRLFPALLVVIPAVLALCWLVLFENEYREAGRHAAASAAFHVNLTLLREVDYFDGPAGHKPFRHLWSLAVEEQFYLAWPLLLLVLFRLKTPATGVLMLATGSVLASWCWVDGTGRSQFFLVHLRAWELLLGAWAAMLPALLVRWLTRPLLRDGLQLAGLVAVVLTAVMVRGGTAPVLSVAGSAMGTFLLIVASGGCVSQWLLATRPLVWLGRISYPLYLWHWPLIALANVVFWDQVPPAAMSVVVLSALVLSWGTYLWVERPVHRSALFAGSPWVVFLVLGGGMLLVWMGAFGVAHRRPPERLFTEGMVRTQALEDHGTIPPDHMPGRSAGTVLFLGDSYVAQLFPRVERLRTEGRPMRTVRFHVRAGCPPLGVELWGDPGCREWSEEGFRKAMDPEVKEVVLGGSWLSVLRTNDHDASGSGWPVLEQGLDHLERRVAELVNAGKQVHLLLNPPGGKWAHPGNATHLRLHGEEGERSGCSMDDHRARTGEVNVRLRVLAERTGVSVIDPEGWVCDADSCWAGTATGVPFFSDATHFRRAFVRVRVRELDHILCPPDDR